MRLGDLRRRLEGDLPAGTPGAERLLLTPSGQRPRRRDADLARRAPPPRPAQRTIGPQSPGALLLSRDFSTSPCLLGNSFVVDVSTATWYRGPDRRGPAWAYWGRSTHSTPCPGASRLHPPSLQACARIVSMSLMFLNKGLMNSNVCTIQSKVYISQENQYYFHAHKYWVKFLSDGFDFKRLLLYQCFLNHSP